MLANALGAEGVNSVLEAACMIAAPIKLWEAVSNIETTLNGFYDKQFALYM